MLIIFSSSQPHDNIHHIVGRLVGQVVGSRALLPECCMFRQHRVEPLPPYALARTAITTSSSSSSSSSALGSLASHHSACSVLIHHLPPHPPIIHTECHGNVGRHSRQPFFWSFQSPSTTLPSFMELQNPYFFKQIYYLSLASLPLLSWKKSISSPSSPEMCDISAISANSTQAVMSPRQHTHH